MRFATVVLLFLTLMPAALADERLADDPGVAQALRLVETWVEAQRMYEGIPGISAALVHDQEVVWEHGFGVADRERGTPATPETIYSICSISKLFTSIGVMQLRDQGRLELGDSIDEHLPWFDLVQTHPEGPPITLWGLLTHSAGLPRESDYPYWNLPDFPFPTLEELKQRLGEQETLYPASKYFQYSNLGLSLLGQTVAEVSGQSFEAYVQAQIVEPLGLADTRPELPVTERGKRMATGYGARSRDGSRAEISFFQARAIAPAAGFSSTVQDLGKFASWQFRLLEAGDDEVLAANTLREMHRVQWLDPDWKVSRGLGFGVYRVKDTTYVGHSGSCPGFRSTLRMRTDKQLAVIFMANASGVAPEAWAGRTFQIVAPAIAKALKSEDDEEPETESDDTEPVVDFEKYVGNYDIAPWGGETAVLPWKEGLAMLFLPTDDPLEALSELRHIEDHVFRRVRDDEELGEEIVFEIDAEGRSVALRRHSLSWPRID
jgi:CubicO group peptidase (beta-lactamase class C family)